MEDVFSSNSANKPDVTFGGRRCVSSDKESPPHDGSAIDFTNRHVRKDFRQKVYLIFMFQYLTVFCVVVLFLFLTKWLKLFDKSEEFILTTVVLMNVIIISMICFEFVRRTVPYNHIYLAAFICVESLMTASVAVKFDPKTALIVIGIKTLYSVTLGLLSLQTSYDCGVCRSFLALLLVGTASAAVASVYSRPYLPEAASAVGCGLLVFSIIMYDVNLLLRENIVGCREHIYAVLNLYILLYLMRVICFFISETLQVVILFL